MRNRSGQEKVTLFFEFTVPALAIVLFGISHFELYEIIDVWLLMIMGWFLFVAIHHLLRYLFFKSKLIRALLILIASATWGALAFIVVRILRSSSDGSTLACAILVFVVTLLAYIHFHFKTLFKSPF